MLEHQRKPRRSSERRRARKLVIIEARRLMQQMEHARGHVECGPGCPFWELRLALATYDGVRPDVEIK